MAFLNPFAIMKYVKRNSLKKKIQNGSATRVTQEEAQVAFEKAEFDPSFAYADLASLIFTAFFLQPILPIGAGTSFIGLILTYYSYKKKLVKDSKRPVMVTDDIAEVTLYLLNCAPFVYGVALSHPAFLDHLRQDAARHGRGTVGHHHGAWLHQHLLSSVSLIPQLGQRLLQKRPVRHRAKLQRRLRRT